MAAKLGPLVDRALSVFGVPIEPHTREALDGWLTSLQKWNERIDLTAARSPEELVDLMLADALVLTTRVERGARVVDVGTGAGAPGLALALLRPDLHMTLVEPSGKRTSFLRSVLGMTSRADVAIERARGEAFADRRAWDVALSRATLAPETWLGLATRLAGPEGSAWLFLAKEAPPANPGARLEESIEYVWPLTGARRTAARYTVF